MKTPHQCNIPDGIIQSQEKAEAGRASDPETGSPVQATGRTGLASLVPQAQWQVLGTELHLDGCELRKHSDKAASQESHFYKGCQGPEVTEGTKQFSRTSLELGCRPSTL